MVSTGNSRRWFSWTFTSSRLYGYKTLWIFNLGISKVIQAYGLGVATSLYGDIPFDLSKQNTSFNLNENGFGVYEPIHGSAPDSANKNVVNPIATILSVAMLFQYTFKRVDIYNHILESVKMVLNDGKYTKDLSEVEFISTSEMGDCIIQKIEELYND